MADEKKLKIKNYVVISDTFVEGKHVKKGTSLEIDHGTSAGMEVHALLEGAGRIREVTAEELADAQKQAEAERKSAVKIGDDNDENENTGKKGKK